MAKWMSEQFMKGLSEKVKKSLTDPFKELTKEYNSLKKLEQLPKFVEKVWDYYPKANKYEVCLINLFDPALGYTHDLAEIDETAKETFFKRIEAFAKVDPLPGCFSTPRCVRMFKDADGYEVDEIEKEDSELAETEKTETASDTEPTKTTEDQTGSSDTSGNN